MRSALIVLMSSCLVSCAASPIVPEVSPSPTWKPLPPSSLGAVRAATQRLRAAFGDQELSLDCAVSVTAESITVIGLAPAGPRVFTVSYDGRQVEAQANRAVPKALEPERLLNDLQLTLWPRQALELAFENSRWRITEPDARTRRLLRDGKLVTEVHYATADPWTSRTWLVSFDGGYTISVDSQPLD
jgi:hypothetical protein